VVEGALPVKHHVIGSTARNQNKNKGKRKKVPTCEHCSKFGHPPFRCWKRPDAKCNKCNQLGHKALICKDKSQQNEVNVQVVEQDEEDQMFTASCYSKRSDSECWLIDSGCINHMTHDKTLFKDLKPTKVSEVRIWNGSYIPVNGI